MFRLRASCAAIRKSRITGRMGDGFDPKKNAANQAKHGLPLAFGSRIFEDENQLVIPSIRARDGEERFKVVGMVG